MVDKEAQRIRAMFATIAPRYDLANRLLSMRFDVGWRRYVARHLLPGPGRVLDLAAGTGDLAIDLHRTGHHSVVPSDFTMEMLLAGRSKMARRLGRDIPLVADALCLPFRSGGFDGVTVAFGIRNFFDPRTGLQEMHRILRSGGAAGILEFSRPSSLLRLVYSRYFNRVLPILGGVITGSRSSYEYLTRSVSEFPEGEAFLEWMREAGFRRLTARRLSGGIVTFYRGEKP
ncbi:MAG TPA: ubiquinone/menaquinone biosynthesis methyltransferase [Thermoanaerobaculia bacterium]|nr:ubiquinone/menaquinone biosynthesis methyltransferase [Thermoanaerobaculia bacterium]